MHDRVVTRTLIMKKILLTLASVMALGLASQAQPSNTSVTNSASDYLGRRFGAGLMIGEPLGVSLKYWLNDTMAIDGGIGESFHHDNGLQLHSDVLWHAFDLLKVPEGRLPLYFGVGARLKFEDGDDRFGIRVPVGLSYMLENDPVDIFLEVAPILDLSPSVHGDFNAAIGVRFWF